jgi:hypothetical protein
MFNLLSYEEVLLGAIGLRAVDAELDSNFSLLNFFLDLCNCIQIL